MMRQLSRKEPMFRMSLPADRVEPDMTARAKAFGISISDMESLMHIGSISRWLEVGEGDEDNKPHQIFNSKALGIRVDVNERGSVRSITGQSASEFERHHKNIIFCDDNAETEIIQDSSRSKAQNIADIAQATDSESFLDDARDESVVASGPITTSSEPPKPNDFYFAKSR